MTPGKKVITRWARTNNFTNKNDTTMLRASEKSSRLGLPKYFVAGRNFDRQHCLIKQFWYLQAQKSPKDRKIDLIYCT